MTLVFLLTKTLIENPSITCVGAPHGRDAFIASITHGIAPMGRSYGVDGNQAAFFAAATAFFAPSLMSSAGVIARPLDFSSALPSSTLVPSRRTITGTLTSTDRKSTRLNSSH